MSTTRGGPGFADRILEATAGAGVDVVLNTLGPEFLPENLHALAASGHYVDITKTAPSRPYSKRWVRDRTSCFTRSIWRPCCRRSGAHSSGSRSAVESFCGRTIAAAAVPVFRPGQRAERVPLHAFGAAHWQDRDPTRAFGAERKRRVIWAHIASACREWRPDSW